MLKKLLLLVLLGLVVALGVQALSPQWQSFGRMGERRTRALQHKPREIVVGVCWPFSVNQDGMADGLRLAQEDINVRGLAGGFPMRLVMRDDEYDPVRAKRIAAEFSRDRKMSAVVGYYDSSIAVKASTLYESSRLLHLIVGANSTPMTARGFVYIVRTTLSSDKIARSLAKMAVARGYRKFALIWDEGAYGEDLAHQFRITLDALDAQLVYQWSFSHERADFRLPVNQLKGTDADLIFFAGLEPWAGDFLRAARGVGVKTDILGAFTNTPEMRQRSGSSLEGAMYFDMYDVAAPSTENQAFVREFHERYGRDPDTWAAQGYDALRILANAVRVTRSANPLDLAYAIRFMDPWQGANGRYRFDGRGEMDDKPIYLNVVRHGTPVVIDQSHPAQGPVIR